MQAGSALSDCCRRSGRGNEWGTSRRVKYIYYIFLWRNHKNLNNVFRLVNPVYDMDAYIFKANVSTKQAKHE